MERGAMPDMDKRGTTVNPKRESLDRDYLSGPRRDIAIPRCNPIINCHGQSIHIRISRNRRRLVVRNNNAFIANPVRVHIKHVREGLRREGIVGLAKKIVIDCDGQIHDGSVRIQHVLSLLGEGP